MDHDPDFPSVTGANALSAASGRELPPRVQHLVDTRRLKAEYLEKAMVLVARAGYVNAYLLALRMFPLLPKQTSLRRVQRMLTGACKSGHLERRYLFTGECIYGLTLRGARALVDSGYDPDAYRPTVRSLRDATRVDHRLIANQLIIAGELLGCDGNFEAEAYANAKTWREFIGKVPDGTLSWTENGNHFVSLHEVDLTARRTDDSAAFKRALFTLWNTRGRIGNHDLVAFVCHARTGVTMNRTKSDVADLFADASGTLADMSGRTKDLAWIEGRSHKARAALARERLDADGYLLTPPYENETGRCSFAIMIEPVHTEPLARASRRERMLAWWPGEHGLLLPWRAGGVNELPFERLWSADGPARNSEMATRAIQRAAREVN